MRFIESSRKASVATEPKRLFESAARPLMWGISPQAVSFGRFSHLRTSEPWALVHRTACNHLIHFVSSLRATGCFSSARTMSGMPIAAGNSQNAIWGSSLQSGRFLPLST